METQNKVDVFKYRMYLTTPVVWDTGAPPFDVQHITVLQRQDGLELRATLPANPRHTPAQILNILKERLCVVFTAAEWSLDVVRGMDQVVGVLKQELTVKPEDFPF